MVEDIGTQRIRRLTPLDAILKLIDAGVGAIEPHRRAITATQGCTLAEDVVAPKRPPHPIALRDGFAVDSAQVTDASPYAPATLPFPPHRIDVGQPLPSDADAVLPLDAVMLRGGRAEAVAAVAAGGGVLPAGGDATPCRPLRRAGERVRTVDIAAMRAAGVADIAIREPRVSVALGSAAGSAVIDTALALLVRAISDAGAAVPGSTIMLDAAVADRGADAVVAVGGTGSGRHDGAVAALSRLGRVDVHGIAVSPGETAAFGGVGTRPVLLIPGRLDSTLAIWLLIGRHLVARLAGGRVEAAPTMLPLKRKVASAIGLTELVPVACGDGMAEPLATGYLSFEALARSDGWIVVPADSEGFAAGTPVAVGSWP